MIAKDAGLLRGTVELLVLKALSWGPMHGYGIASWIEGITDDVQRLAQAVSQAVTATDAGRGAKQHA